MNHRDGENKLENQRKRYWKIYTEYVEELQICDKLLLVKTEQQNQTLRISKV